MMKSNHQHLSVLDYKYRPFSAKFFCKGLMVGLFCVSVQLFAPVVKAADLTVSFSTDKVAYDPTVDERVIVKVAISNNEASSVELNLSVMHSCHLDGWTTLQSWPAVVVNQTWNGKTSWQIPRGGTTEAETQWGCEVVLKVNCDTCKPESLRQVFVVSTKPLMTTANYSSVGGHVYDGAWYEADVGAKPFFEYWKKCAVPMFEFAKYTHDNWGEHIAHPPNGAENKCVSDDLACFDGTEPECGTTNLGYYRPCNGSNYEFMSQVGADTYVCPCHFKAFVQRAQKLGMTVLGYARSSDSFATNGLALEDALYYGPEGSNNSEDCPRQALGQCYTNEDPLCLLSAAGSGKRIDKGLKAYFSLVNTYGFDGIRWDGMGAMTHPRFNSIACGSGSCWHRNGYDYQGQAIAPQNPDPESTALSQYLNSRYRGKKTSSGKELLIGYNNQGANQDYPGSVCDVRPSWYKESLRELLRGRMLLDEYHYKGENALKCGLGQHDHPTRVGHSWTIASHALRRAVENTKRIGAYHYTGSMPIYSYHNPDFHRATLAMTYAAGSRPTAVCLPYLFEESWKDMKLKERRKREAASNSYPDDYIEYLSFAQRFAEYLFHPSMVAVGGEAQKADVTNPSLGPRVVKVDTFREQACEDCGTGTCVPADCVLWKPFEYQLFIGGKWYFIVHLFNRPQCECKEGACPTCNNGKQYTCERMDQMTRLPEAMKIPAEVEKAEVHFRQPQLFDTSRLSAYVMSPEFAVDGQDWRKTAHTETLPNGLLAVTVPKFQWWAMVIVEYPLEPQTRSGSTG